VAALAGREARDAFAMTIKAVVFDAYGTLYDVQSVARAIDEAFPGHGEVITQIWRQKQLEYTWLRSLMGRYEDFAAVTRDALKYALSALGLAPQADIFERLLVRYEHLELYPDALGTLTRLQGRTLAILSNGSPAMLGALVRNTGLDPVLDATISVDRVKAYKPSPQAYALVESVLGLKPAEVLFVSSNPFDICGAKAFGFTLAWVQRLAAPNVTEGLTTGALVRPHAMFNALRMQMDELGFAPDFRIRALSDLVAIAGD